MDVPAGRVGLSVLSLLSHLMMHIYTYINMFSCICVSMLKASLSPTTRARCVHRNPKRYVFFFTLNLGPEDGGRAKEEGDDDKTVFHGVSSCSHRFKMKSRKALTGKSVIVSV